MRIVLHTGSYSETQLLGDQIKTPSTKTVNSGDSNRREHLPTLITARYIRCRCRKPAKLELSFNLCLILSWDAGGRQPLWLLVVLVNNITFMDIQFHILGTCIIVSRCY